MTLYYDLIVMKKSDYMCVIFSAWRQCTNTADSQSVVRHIGYVTIRV